MNVEKLKDYFYVNIASLFWTSFLLVGGGVFIWYFSYIEYMPDFDLKSSLTILSAASITSIIIIVFFIAVLIFPGSFWSDVWANNSSLKENWEDDNGENDLSKTVLWFGLPVLYCFGLWVLIIYVGLVAFFYAAVGVILAFLIVRHNSELSGWELRKQVVGFVLVSLFCSFMSLYPAYLVLSFVHSGLPKTKEEGELIWVGVAIFIAFANVVLTAKPKNRYRAIYYLWIGGITLFVVFDSYSKMYRIPERVMEIFKFGAIDAKSLVVTKDSYEFLKIQGFVTGDNCEQEICLISNVKILSRLGKEMYLESGKLRFSIKNSDVLSWSVEKPSK
ncbi:hypothetical protein [Photobacterium sp. TY1-4]|uniref:hypothetical protein n=1 Tax=Photobacterium sp. TY1-4 TaxID=2899122 RepID=UPI0021BF0138|nr:hypothetical protein [Photobacterium sp. TY1-4]UXI03400.1 hypothetical protein NH461_23535 [Photobacterium sp. TY1-4]